MLFLLTLALAAPASAHTGLVVADPAPGARLVEAPARLRLTFSEPLGPASNLVLLRADFTVVSGVVATIDRQMPEQLEATLPPLEAGVYTVQWEAISLDGHAVSGSYQFTVGKADAGATARRLWPWFMLAGGLSLTVLIVIRRGAKK
jgi:methionine-rich copper-binding protein CopC